MLGKKETYSFAMTTASTNCLFIKIIQKTTAQDITLREYISSI